MKTEVIELTPTLARRLLDSNDINRPIDQKHVDFLATQIKAGLWDENGASVVISSTGRLLDGQHRCWAVIDADMSITVVLVAEVSEEARYTIDSGNKVRTAANALVMKQVPNANRAAAVIRGIYNLAYNRPNYRITPRQVVDFAERHPFVQDAVQYTTGVKRSMPLRYLGSLHYINHAYTPWGKKVDDFIEVFKTGEDNSMLYSPALAAYEFYDKWAERKTKLGEIDEINILLRSWEAYRTGTQRKSPWDHKGLVMDWHIEGFNLDVFNSR